MTIMAIFTLLLCLGLTTLLGGAILARVATAEHARAVASRPVLGRDLGRR